MPKMESGSLKLLDVPKLKLLSLIKLFIYPKSDWAFSTNTDAPIL